MGRRGMPSTSSQIKAGLFLFLLSKESSKQLLINFLDNDITIESGYHGTPFHENPNFIGCTCSFIISTDKFTFDQLFSKLPEIIGDISYFGYVLTNHNVGGNYRVSKTSNIKREVKPEQGPYRTAGNNE